MQASLSWVCALVSTWGHAWHELAGLLNATRVILCACFARVHHRSVIQYLRMRPQVLTSPTAYYHLSTYLPTFLSWWLQPCGNHQDMTVRASIFWSFCKHVYWFGLSVASEMCISSQSTAVWRLWAPGAGCITTSTLGCVHSGLGHHGV